MINSTRILICLLSALLLGGTATGQRRQNVVVFPFAAGEDQTWLSTATAHALSAKLDRTGQLRPLDREELAKLGRSINVDIRKAGELPLPAINRIGHWLNTDLLIIGRVGRTHDRDRARELVGSVLVSKNAPEGSEIWLAARLYGYPGGTSLGSAFVEGSESGLFDLFDGLTLQILDRLGVDEARAMRAYGRPTHSVEAYHLIAEADAAFHTFKRSEKTDRFIAEALNQALRLDPDYSEAHRVRGDMLHRQGDEAGAREAYGQAAALDPDNPRPRWSLAMLSRAQDDVASEAEALASVLEAQPEDDRAFVRIARLHFEAGRHEEARTHYERALALFNKEPGRLAEVGSFFLYLGEADAADRLFRKAIEIEPGNPDHHVGSIAARTRKRFYVAADGAFSEAIAMGSESADLWQVAGQLSVIRKKYDDASERYQHALKLAPERTDLLLDIANLHADRGNIEQAVTAYEDALIKGVPLEDIADPLVKAYTRLDDDGAADSFIQSLALDTNRLDILLIAARLNDERGNHQAAVVAYEDALIKGAPIADIAGPLARAYMNLEDGTAVERILGSVPDRPDLAAIRGDLYESTGSLRKAMGAYETALASTPDNVDLLKRLGRVYERLGSRESAAEVYTKALQNAPGEIDLLITLGDVLRELDRNAEARPRYQAAIDAGAKRVDAFNGLGLSAEALRRLRESRLAYRNALFLDPQNAIALAGLQRVRPPRRPSLPSPQALITQARDALTQGDFEKAIDLFQTALRRDGRDGSAWNDLGLAHAALGHPHEARQAFESAERLAPTPETIYNLGRSSVESGRYQEAVSAYRTALERDPGFAEAALNLSALQLQEGHAPSAVLTLKQALEVSPDRGDVRLALANAYLLIQEPESARRAYEEATADPIQRAAATVGLGNLALAAGDTVVAIDHYRDAIRQNAEIADPYINLGSVLAVQGQAGAAIESYTTALEKAPEDLTIYLNLATLYYQSEQYDDALDLLGVLLRRNSSIHEAQRLVGHIALATGDPGLAIEAYHIALSMSPADLGALRGLALACEADHRVEAARDAWHRWIDAAGDSPGFDAEIERIHSRLESLPDES